jgi:hypothetical protein
VALRAYCDYCGAELGLDDDEVFDPDELGIDPEDDVGYWD